ncbi:MAG: DUF4129 domain-containing protein [Acidobacteriota bacterium]
MDLEKLAVRLRPRNDWEAADLGFTMVRAWLRPVFGAWLAIAAPVLVLLVATLGGWGLLLFWWLLPLWEIPSLLVLSRRVFGSPSSTGEVLRATPGHWRRCLADITWRRFNPWRSFALPVAHLEGSGGSARRDRLRVLESRGTEVPLALSASFFLFQFSIGLGLFVLLLVMTPDWVAIDWERIVDGIFEGAAPAASRVLYVLLGCGTLVVNPFYVAAGFCIYLNRRTDLEGWDLEIAFRGMASRIRELSRSSRPRTAAALALAALLAGLAGAPSARAETLPPAESVAPAEGTPTGAKHAVYARPELQTRETVERWKLKEGLVDSGLFDFDTDSEPSWRGGAGFEIPGLAQVFEVALWVGAGLLVLLMLREIWRAAPRGGASRRDEPRPAAARVLGMDVREESLPEDVAGEAERLWRTGQEEAALSLLYRGALSRLLHEGLQLRESFTEADCLRAARRFLTTERTTFLTRLTAAWQSAAYAHRRLDLDQALDLCRGWRRTFPAATAAAAAASPGQRTP